MEGLSNVRNRGSRRTDHIDRKEKRQMQLNLPEGREIEQNIKFVARISSFAAVSVCLEGVTET